TFYRQEHSAFASLAANPRHVLPVLADRFPSLAADVRHMLPVTADPLATLAANAGHVLPILAHPLSAFLPARRHVVAIAAHSRAPFARDPALLLIVHRGKSAHARRRRIGLILFLLLSFVLTCSHCKTPFAPPRAPQMSYESAPRRSVAARI